MLNFYGQGKFGLMARHGMFEQLTGVDFAAAAHLHMGYNLVITVPTVLGSSGKPENCQPLPRSLPGLVGRADPPDQSDHLRPLRRWRPGVLAGRPHRWGLRGFQR